MGKATEVQIPSLPLAIHRGTAMLDQYVGTGGMAHVFHAQLVNLPALVGELMIARECDPGVFKLNIPFRYGGDPITDGEQVRAIRTRSDQLWGEFQRQSKEEPVEARKAQEGYLRVIDSRLLKNPHLAVKVLRKDRADEATQRKIIDKFTRENLALRKLNHRNIIRRYACLDDPKMGPCLLLEYIRGRSLEQIWQRRRDQGKGPIPLAALAHIAYQLAQALSHAHENGVAHCDIKPANILSVQPTKEELAKGKVQGLVKLSDFGISRFLNEPVGNAPAKPAGTLQFIAPEQFRGEHPNPLTDVYQLGITFYVMATNRIPYDNLSADEIRQKIVRPDPHPTRVHHFRGDIAPKFEAVIEGAREKDPKKRWPLERVLEEIAQLYTGRQFTVNDMPPGSMVEELLDRVQINAALKDFYRAVETLDVAEGFMDSVPKERQADITRRFDQLKKQYTNHKGAVSTMKEVQRLHISPVDMLMEELYDRYGRGAPLLKEDEKGVMQGEGEDLQIVRRSLIDKIMHHTQEAIRKLADIDPDLVGEMHRKMVDRAASQEEACTDLIAREVKFGDDYHNR